MNQCTNEEMQTERLRERNKELRKWTKTVVYENTNIKMSDWELELRKCSKAERLRERQIERIKNEWKLKKCKSKD